MTCGTPGDQISCVCRQFRSMASKDSSKFGLLVPPMLENRSRAIGQYFCQRDKRFVFPRELGQKWIDLPCIFPRTRHLEEIVHGYFKVRFLQNLGSNAAVFCMIRD